MNKNILILLLVLVIAVLGYLQFKPKNTENIYPVAIVAPTGQTTTNNTPQQVNTTQSQKTYTDIQYGFSFQYPSTWKTPTSTPNGNILEVYASEAITTPFIAHYASGITLDSFITEAYGHSVSDIPQQITVSGYKGYKYTYETSTNGRGAPNPLFNQQVAFEDGKGGLFVINYAVRPANKTEGITTFNQILSSFKL